jgi:hypothetical protein
MIAQAQAVHGERVVVLVDEYDKPILDNLTRDAAAREIRDGLRNLYSVIEDSDAHIRFAFLTGVSKFSKVSLCSGLNNLIDITVSRGYSAICGYTEGDLDTVFGPELDGLDRGQIREWYNGYNWTGEAVYNPFDHCSCCASVSSAHGGSKPPRRPSWWTCSQSAGPGCRPWATWRRMQRCFRPSTSGT